MGDKADAQRLTGYVLGGISPFGTKRPLPVVADATLMLSEKVCVSGGRRGLEIRIAPSDLVAALTADGHIHLGGSTLVAVDADAVNQIVGTLH